MAIMGPTAMAPTGMPAMPDMALAEKWCGPELQASAPGQVIALQIGGHDA
eukprot:SAG22_NODE_18758_length_282_cov_0.573770_1_plen_49_part_01